MAAIATSAASQAGAATHALNPDSPPSRQKRTSTLPHSHTPTHTHAVFDFVCFNCFHFSIYSFSTQSEMKNGKTLFICSANSSPHTHAHTHTHMHINICTPESGLNLILPTFQRRVLIKTLQRTRSFFSSFLYFSPSLRLHNTRNKFYIF